MISNLTIDVRGDKVIARYLKRYPALAEKAARLSVNDTLRFGRARVKREILKEINFPRSYLDGKSSRGRRLDVRYASPDELSGAIIGRREATSLTRFVTKWEYEPYKTRAGKRPFAAQVKVGRRTKTIPGSRGKGRSAFLVQLRNGNQGLALRLPKGERPDSRGAKKLRSDIYGDTYLLYGPSVQQAMLNNAGRGIAKDVQPSVEQYLNREFRRQFGRLAGGR